jgi:hypothetical protein
MDSWKTYSIPISTNTADANALVPADPTAIDFFALQARSNAFRGAIYVDWIVFKSKNGTTDTVYNFNQKAPEEGNDNVVAIKLYPTSDVSNDMEWQTATTSKWDGSPVRMGVVALNNSLNMHVLASRGNIRLFYNSEKAMSGMITLRDLQGRTLFSQKFQNIAGRNELTIPDKHSGPVILQISQGSRVLISKVISVY